MVGRGGLKIPAVEAGLPASERDLLTFFHKLWALNADPPFGLGERLIDAHMETVLLEDSKPLTVVRSDFTKVKEETLVRKRWESTARPNTGYGESIQVGFEKHSVLVPPERLGSFRSLVSISQTHNEGHNPCYFNLALYDGFSVALDEQPITPIGVMEDVEKLDSYGDYPEVDTAFESALGKVLDRAVELLT
jgi:hypothetical protein